VSRMGLRIVVVGPVFPFTRYPYDSGL
jgi:hypothetical protein